MRCKTTGRIWSTILSYLNRLVIGLTDFTCLKSYFSTVPRACINIFFMFSDRHKPSWSEFCRFLSVLTSRLGVHDLSRVRLYVCARVCVWVVFTVIGFHKTSSCHINYYLHTFLKKSLKFNISKQKYHTGANQPYPIRFGPQVRKIY